MAGLWAGWSPPTLTAFIVSSLAFYGSLTSKATKVDFGSFVVFFVCFVLFTFLISV